MERQAGNSTLPSKPFLQSQGAPRDPGDTGANGRSGAKGTLKLKDGMGLGWGVYGASEEPGAQRAWECSREEYVKV